MDGFIATFEVKPRTQATYARHEQHFRTWVWVTLGITDPYAANLEATTAGFLEHRRATSGAGSLDQVAAAIRWQANRLRVPFDPEELGDYRRGAARWDDKLAAAGNPIARALLPSEVARLITSPRTHPLTARDQAAVALAWHMLLTVREIRSIQINDVTPTTDGYRVRLQSRTRNVIGPDTFDLRRTDDDLCPVRALDRWLCDLREVAPNAAGGDPLFPASHEVGNRLPRGWSDAQMGAAMRQLAGLAGIPDARWMGVRAGYAAAAREAGVTDAQLQQMAGLRKYVSAQLLGRPSTQAVAA